MLVDAKVIIICEFYVRVQSFFTPALKNYDLNYDLLCEPCVGAIGAAVGVSRASRRGLSRGARWRE